MKLAFRQRPHLQPALTTFQESNRKAKPHRWPIARLLAMSLGLLAIGSLGWCWHGSGRIRTYGLVCAHTVEVRTPMQATVSALYVSPGDRVEAGDLLCLLASGEAATALADARAAAAAAEAERDRLRDGPDPRRAAIDAQTVEQARRACEEARARATAATDLQAQRSQASASATADRLDAQRALDRVHLLVQLDAALPDELSRAERRRDEAIATERAAAAAAGPAAEREAAATAADLAAAQRTYEQVSAALAQAGEGDRSQRDRALAAAETRLAACTAEVARLTAAADGEHRAPCRGVVIAAPWRDGTTVPAGAPAITLAATDRIWVEAWVPPDRLKTLQSCRRATVTAPGGRDLDGEIEAGGAVQRPLPAEVASRLPTHEGAGVFVRIGLDEPGPLLPGNVVRVLLH